MSVIINPVFTEREKTLLEFILQHDFSERSAVIDQLNSMKAADIVRDVTPYCWIMEFRSDGVASGYRSMGPYISFEVMHGDGIVSTVFTLYGRNGLVFELEIYNADSSTMDLSKIMIGEIYVHSNT